MNFRKRMLHCTILSAAAVALITTSVPAVAAPTAGGMATLQEELASDDEQTGPTAGGVSTALSGLDEQMATIVVNESDEQQSSTQSSDEEDSWSDKLMADVDESLNVRKKASKSSKVVGKLYAGSLATVVEIGDKWTHIKSGNVDGYVKNEYCVYGADAKKLASKVCKQYAKSTTQTLRIREKASEDADVLGLLAKGDKLEVNTKAKTKDGWVAVKYDGSKAYVSADYVKVKTQYTKALTVKEEQEKIAKEKARAAAKSSSSSSTTTDSGTSASADDATLLGALIYIEAGSGSAAGQLAVGAVVINRVQSSRYPNTISGVIYQSGQFATGRISSIISGGVPSSCMSAAKQAIAGSDNTGGCLSFRSASTGHSGTQIGGNVFF